MHFTTGPQWELGDSRERQIAPGGKTATRSQTMMSGEGDSPRGTSQEFSSVATMDFESDLLPSQNCTALRSVTRESTKEVGGPRSDKITGSQTMKTRTC